MVEFFCPYYFEMCRGCDVTCREQIEAAREAGERETRAVTEILEGLWASEKNTPWPEGRKEQLAGVLGQLGEILGAFDEAAARAAVMASAVLCLRFLKEDHSGG